MHIYSGKTRGVNDVIKACGEFRVIAASYLARDSERISAYVIYTYIHTHARTLICIFIFDIFYNLIKLCKFYLIKRASVKSHTNGVITLSFESGLILNSIIKYD